jgi:hypothetical protein
LRSLIWPSKHGQARRPAVTPQIHLITQRQRGHKLANSPLKTIGGGKTYAQLSAEAIAQPKNAALAAQVNTVFKGETLRGLLLNAYAFGTMGTIAGIAAIGAFIAAAVMLLLSGLGLMHARRTSPAAELLNGPPADERTPATASTPASQA